MRVREFTQDDAHIYCLREQMQAECINIIKLTLNIYNDFGFKKIKIKFSDRPPKRIGNDDVWDFLEDALIQSTDLFTTIAQMAGSHISVKHNSESFYPY